MNALFAALAAMPRARLLSGATPLARLDRLSARYGLDLWIKRDDLTGLGFGGNKVRQLEFYFGAAVEQSADTILITGAVQSNYVRAAAAAAAKLGMKTIVQLEERVPGMDETYRTSGNVLLGRLLGAEYMHYAHGEDETGADRALGIRADELLAEGRRPYVVPLSLDNPPLGALGYMLAAREIADAAPTFDAVVVASGSGQTHVGLLAGLRALNVETPVHGVCVRRDAAAQHDRIRTLAGKLAGLLESGVPVDERDILLWDGALAPGYGRMGAEAESALLQMAREEGLFLDPVYTAKSFAGVPGLLRKGALEAGMRVLFIHTGGVPALFGYANALPVT